MTSKNRINRRSFIKTSFAGAVGAGVLRDSGIPPADFIKKPDKQKIKEYRTLGRTGFNVSDISFGAVDVNSPGVLIEAINMGMNYIDTAEVYGRGMSEKVVGEVVKKFDRKKIFITTKLYLNPRVGRLDEEGLKERTFKCLERLQTDYVDCMMIHMCQVDQVKDKNFHAAMAELKSAGKIRFLGLSNHGKNQSISGPTKDTMTQVINAAAEDGRFDVVLFTYNFILKEQGDEILKICRDKNIGTTLMKTNPVNKFKEYSAKVENMRKERGEIRPELRKMITDYEKYSKKAEAFIKEHELTDDGKVRDAAIRFVLNNPDVHTTTITFSNFDKLRAHLALSGTRLDSSDAGMLKNYKKMLGNYYCRHSCGICESECPHKVPVNTIMRYNHYFGAQGREKYAMVKYNGLPTAKADVCFECSGKCEKACPYKVPIHSLIMAAHTNLALG